MTNGEQPRAKAYTQIAASVGAMIGCVAAALAGDWLGRRMTYALLCIGSMAAITGLYQLNDSYTFSYLVWAFIAGGITAAFYGWLPLYLPELFRTRVRATGQGFGFNFGRILAAVGVLQLPVVMNQLNVGWQGACTVMSVIYVVGLALIWFAHRDERQAFTGMICCIRKRIWKNANCNSSEREDFFPRGIEILEAHEMIRSLLIALAFAPALSAQGATTNTRRRDPDSSAIALCTDRRFGVINDNSLLTRVRAI